MKRWKAMPGRRGRLRRVPAGIVAASLALAGCSFAPVSEMPAPPLPEQWSTVPGSGAEVSAAATLDWPTFVTDERLRELVGLALTNNRDLRQALLDIEAARAQYRVRRADRLPGLDVQAGGTRQRSPGDLTVTGEPEIEQRYQAGLGMTAFELDLFGRVGNLSAAALHEYQATGEAARGVQISLVAEVIQTYLARDGALRRHLLTERTLAARETSLELVARRKAAGVASALEYQEALGLREQARAELERLDREVRQAGNALALLVGVADLVPYLPQQPGDDILLVQSIAAGAPAELLVHRPDIRVAEHRLRARNADIGAARAAFFPRITLTGLFGTASAELSDLFGSGQRAWSFSPQLVLPIFDAGRNRANLDLAGVRKDMAIVGYEQSIQTAFREVADALVATDTLYREELARRALAQSSRQALELSEARYRAGVDDHLRYLDAQRSDFAHGMALIEVATQRQLALVALYRALGGGWLADSGGV